ncbi:MAG TPA: hypothetical protein DCX32_03135 [Candidatus Moranbacteria bacterium]|nr:hypothetical protein [Candidatus Moranbacteria bacterium]
MVQCLITPAEKGKVFYMQNDSNAKMKQIFGGVGCITVGCIGERREAREKEKVLKARHENHARVLEEYKNLFGDSDPLSRGTNSGGNGHVFPIRPDVEISSAVNDR